MSHHLFILTANNSETWPDLTFDGEFARNYINAKAAGDHLTRDTALELIGALEEALTRADRVLVLPMRINAAEYARQPSKTLGVLLHDSEGVGDDSDVEGSLLESIALINDRLPGLWRVFGVIETSTASRYNPRPAPSMHR